ncbi:MAG TPA: class I SAM-dependent methyltransferase [Parafilimonas sp.]|jgi:SAM-dependent methyltransferase
MTVNKYVKKFYPEAKLLGYTFVDGTVVFYNAVNKLIGKNAMQKTFLDLGCGRGRYMYDEKGDEEISIKELRNFKGKVKKVIGIDVDKNAAANPALDEFRLIETDKAWPLEDASIDICVCDYVMEHISDVPFFFSELRRVLKKGGIACFRTPNKFGYMAIFSGFIPNSLHTRILKKVQPDRGEQDVFPVVYKCNTRKAFRRYYKEHEFDSFVFYYEAEPSYFKFSYISFALGYYLHKILPHFLKNKIFSFGIKR